MKTRLQLQLQRRSLLLFISIVLTLAGCTSSSEDNNDSEPLASNTDSIDSESEFCPAGALYDETEDACYIDCTGLSDAACDVLATDVFGDFDTLIDENFSGDAPLGENDRDDTLARYMVESDLSLTLIDNQQPENDAPFRAIWSAAQDILPVTELQNTVSEYHISTDGDEGTLAYITPDDNMPGQWIVAFDPADYVSAQDKEFIHTTIHEFGHIVFLGDGQVDMTMTGSCPGYAIDEGCALEHSFLNMFYQQFWTTLKDEHDVIASSADPDIALETFYDTYADQFVSEYAATNPVEDAAEVFTRFVLTSRPTNSDSITQQKVLSLYQHAELVQLRTIIRGKLIRK